MMLTTTAEPLVNALETDDVVVDAPAEASEPSSPAISAPLLSVRLRRHGFEVASVASLPSRSTLVFLAVAACVWGLAGGVATALASQALGHGVDVATILR